MSSERDSFLEVVAALAHEIADAAIWFDGRCNWMGRHSRGSSDHAGPAGMEALGPDLYGGSSGVALFLAEAGVKLDDRGLRATALGAIRHALHHAGDVHPDVRDGLYGGLVGIAYSATRVGEGLGAEEAVTGARRLLRTWRQERTGSRASDVMNGCSGAVVALAALQAQIDEPWLAGSAAELGDELTAAARITPEGWSWPAPGGRDMYGLCGYAHGAAGIGHAFFELFDLCGDARFRAAGQRAFDYERSWIDRRTRAWPDLRGVAIRAGRDAPVVSANSWCNGATGIALSRLRVAELIDSADVTRDADLGLGICARYASELLEGEPDDFSLCHGAAGLGDALLTSAITLDDPRAGRAAELGRWGVEHTAGRGAGGFPCGVPWGHTPGLLLGLAGIGMFYLRLVDPSVTSPLLVRRERA